MIDVVEYWPNHQVFIWELHLYPTSLIKMQASSKVLTLKCKVKEENNIPIELDEWKY